jgi:Reverse transcriptase (RNA-dependent DNA polymerase)
MKQEFNAIKTKVVWKVIPMSSIPPGRKKVGNRWVYSEKSNGTLRSRTAAQGFSKVPGKDFTDSHARVMTDLALRLALIIKVLIKLARQWCKKFKEAMVGCNYLLEIL